MDSHSIPDVVRKTADLRKALERELKSFTPPVAAERLTNGELKVIAVEMAEAFPDAEPQGMETKIARDLSVKPATVSGWIGHIYRRKKWSRDALVWKLDLLGWTQEEIGEAVGLHQTVVGDVLREIPESEKPLKDMLTREDVPTTAQKLDLPELLVWSVALEGKDDAQRFDALSRLGELLMDMDKATGGKRPKGSRGAKGRISGAELVPLIGVPTFASLGVDKKTAMIEAEIAEQRRGARGHKSNRQDLGGLEGRALDLAGAQVGLSGETLEHVD